MGSSTSGAEGADAYGVESHHLAGPTATRSLLDLGAEVIKIEPPGGEPLRSHGPRADIWMPSPTFLALPSRQAQRGARLQERGGPNSPGATDRRGIGPEQLRSINPRLIYCSVSGFGAGGPMTKMAATDGAVQAFSGVLEMLSPAGTSSAGPRRSRSWNLWSGSMAAQAVLSTLFQRERTGRGAVVDMTMVECALFARMVCSERALESPNTIMATTKDDVTIVVQTAPDFVPRFFELLRDVPELADMADDPRFATPDARIENEELYISRVRAGIATRAADEWYSLFAGAGVPVSPVNTMSNAMGHPQIVNRGAVEAIDVPGLGLTDASKASVRDRRQQARCGLGACRVGCPQRRGDEALRRLQPAADRRLVRRSHRRRIP